VWVRNNSFDAVVVNGSIFFVRGGASTVEMWTVRFLVCMGSDIGPVNFWHNCISGVKTVKLLKM